MTFAKVTLSHSCIGAITSQSIGKHRKHSELALCAIIFQENYLNHQF
jgi:hypothetical protein